MDTTSAAQQAARLLQALLGSVAVGALVVACGGGGVGSTGTGATSGSYSSGTISGFGSVIVNGVRYDTTNVTVADDDEGTASADDSALKLGMEVAIDAGDVQRFTDGSTSKAQASRVSYGSALLGPVSGVDAAGLSLTVLGQSVKVTAATVFDASLSGGLMALPAGAIVNVHGLYDKVTGVTTASRIELKTSPVAFYRLRGVVSELNTMAKTLKIGGQPVSYVAAAAGQINADLANGQVVRAKLDPVQATGVWAAVRIKSAEPRLHDHERQEAELEGVITTYSSKADFKVNGLPVDASASTVVFVNGTAVDLAATGARVEVDGTVINGVLVASKVEFRKSTTDHKREFEFDEKIISSIDTTLKTFVLRGDTIDYSDLGVRFVGGTEADLKNGVKVDVKGNRSADGAQIVATRIKFD
jgi:hypothetical protein